MDLFVNQVLATVVYFSLIQYCVSYSINFRQYSDEGLPKEITAGPGETLYLSWSVSQYPVTHCSIVTPKHTEIELNPSSVCSRICYYGDGFTSGQCGATINNVSLSDTGSWMLNASTASLNKRTSVNFTVLPEIVPFNRTLIIDEGRANRSFTCGSPNPLYVDLTSPRGKKRHFFGPITPDNFVLDGIPSEEEGIWTCKFALSGYMNEYVDQTTVTIAPPVVTDGVIGYNETDKSLNIFCNQFTATSTKQYSLYCALRTPFGQTILLANGKGTKRYKYYGTQLTDCGISINKPLLLTEFGSWRCDNRLSNPPVGVRKGVLNHFGGFVGVKRHQKDVLQYKLETNYELLSSTTTSVYRQISFSCTADASLSYCWFKHPNGSLFMNKPMYENDLNFGSCSFTIDKGLDDSGTWECHLGLKDEPRELRGFISVHVPDDFDSTKKHPLESSVGDKVIIHCNDFLHRAILNCRFIRPDGLGFHFNNQKSYKTYRYLGRGTHFGDCGLEITELSYDDVGSWKCIYDPADLAGSTYQVTYTVTLKEGLSLGSSLFITTLSILLVSLIGIMIFKKYSPFNRRFTPNRSSLLSENDDQSVARSTSFDDGREVTFTNRSRQSVQNAPM